MRRIIIQEFDGYTAEELIDILQREGFDNVVAKGDDVIAETTLSEEELNQSPYFGKWFNAPK